MLQPAIARFLLCLTAFFAVSGDGKIDLDDEAAVRGIGGSNGGDYMRANSYLHALAQKTGGRYYRGDTLMGISQAFAWIADELRRQYSLGYYPKQAAQAGQRRQIKVRVNQPDLVVTARDSYVYAQKKTDLKNVDGQKLTGTDFQSNHLGGTR